MIVDRYSNLLWSVGRAHRLGTADAADVVQTTWLRLVENLGRIQDPERLASVGCGAARTGTRRGIVEMLRPAFGALPAPVTGVDGGRTSAYAEVAEAMGIPIGPTRMRCLDRLRQLTEEAGYAFEPTLNGST